MFYHVLFFILSMLLALGMLSELLLALEALIAWNALDQLLSDRAGVRSHHLCPFLIKNVLADRRKLCHSSLGVVDVELSRQVQLVIDYLVKTDMARRADNGSSLLGSLFNLLVVHKCRVFVFSLLKFCFQYMASVLCKS